MGWDLLVAALIAVSKGIGLRIALTLCGVAIAGSPGTLAGTARNVPGRVLGTGRLPRAQERVGVRFHRSVRPLWPRHHQRHLVGYGVGRGRPFGQKVRGSNLSPAS